MRYAGLGLQLTVSILFCVWIGQKLDARFGATGLFTILGAFLGFGATMWSLMRSLHKDEREGR
jgi:F0F1-type ATP synthase assembly protein I